MKKILIGLVLALSVCTTRATIVMNIREDGSNVRVEASGSVNTEALTPVVNWENQGLDASIAWSTVGSSGGHGYQNITGPSQFGDGTWIDAGTSGGNGIGIKGSENLLLLPVFYSGTDLSGWAEYENQTISGMGLTKGSYEWTWGSGGGCGLLHLGYCSGTNIDCTAWPCLRTCIFHPPSFFGLVVNDNYTSLVVFLKITLEKEEGRSLRLLKLYVDFLTGSQPTATSGI